jgi:beta-glucanase (GH16 family)
MPPLLFVEPLESRRLFAATPLPGNWSLQWADEFNTPPALPTWVTTLWGQTHFPGELQNYTPANVVVANGVVSLTARQELSLGLPYTSGMINTGGDFATGSANLPGFSFRYGYIEARMKLPKGTGLWPAFWMLPTPAPDGTYHDGDGEIDIMETIGSQPTVTEAHLHHVADYGKALRTGIDLSAGFHTYGLDWQADHLTWYFDGNSFFTVTSNVPNVPMYPIFNLAIGDANSWPGAPDATTNFPQSLQIDYVRLFTPAPALPGDANGDGLVDVSDLGSLATNWGRSSGANWSMGDFTADGKVDVSDLGILASNWGSTSSSAIATRAAPGKLQSPFHRNSESLASGILD